jgi:hypothetical protein
MFVEVLGPVKQLIEGFVVLRIDYVLHSTFCCTIWNKEEQSII